MSVHSHQISEGNRVLIFTCTCGDIGRFGTNVHLREALRTGDVTKAGEWKCGWRNGAPVCLKASEEKAA